MVNYRKHTPSPFHGYVVQILDLVSPSTNFIGMCMCLAMSNSATLWTVAHQAPLSIEFPRQEYWSGLPFPSPMHESESEVAQSCPTLSNPMDCSLPGSSIHGIFQAKVLEWGAIAFSEASHS